MQVLYTASALATGDGRDGHVRTSDGTFDLDLAVPKEMGGAGGATNPEQLFAAGYAACFHSALRLVARRAKADVTGSTVTAEVGIGPNGSGGFGLTVALAVALPGVAEVGRRRAGGPGAPGLPVLERHPRQHRGRAASRPGRVTRPAGATTGPTSAPTRPDERTIRSGARRRQERQPRGRHDDDHSTRDPPGEPAGRLADAGELRPRRGAGADRRSRARCWSATR